MSPLPKRYLTENIREDLLKNGKPLFAVECKIKNRFFSKNIHYFKEWISIPIFYQVDLNGDDRQIGDGLIMTSISGFCEYENMI